MRYEVSKTGRCHRRASFPPPLGDASSRFIPTHMLTPSHPPLAPPLSPTRIATTRLASNNNNNQTTHTMSAFLRDIDDAQRLDMKELKDAAVGFEGGRQFVEATDKYEALLVKQEEILGEGHSETMETKASLMRVIDEKINKRGNEEGTFFAVFQTAEVMWREGRFKESMQLNEQVVERLTLTKGPDHFQTLAAMNNMAMAMIPQPRYAEKGLVVLNSVLEKNLRLLGENDSYTMLAMNNVGVALSKLERYEEARQMFKQAVEKQSLILGKFHPLTLHSMHELAITLSYLNRDEEARQLYAVVVEKRSSVLGESHPHTLASMHGLAMTLSYLKLREESRQMYEVVVERRTSVLGESHPDTLWSVSGLAWLQYNLRRNDEAQRTATRGLLLARQVGNAERVAAFDRLLSKLRDYEQSIDPTATDEQKRLREKVRVRKQEANEKGMAMAEAARVATTPEPPMSDADINALMLEFDKMDGGGKKKASSNEGGGGGGGVGGGSKKKKGKKGGKGSKK
jgi:tetratricopeptide (TPR) repeat protein